MAKYRLDLFCCSLISPTFSGVKRGDRVAIYMPMTPEIVVAMLACARIGAMHSIVVSNQELDKLGVNLMVLAYCSLCVCGSAFIALYESRLL